MNILKAIAGAASRNSSSGEFEGAGWGRMLKNWRPGSAGPNAAVSAAVETLRKRSRDSERNNPWAAASTERKVVNAIGTGIKPRSMAPDEEQRRRIQEAWTEDTDHTDADGVLDFYGQQELAYREFKAAGEVFGRFIYRRPEGGRVPLQLQLIEAEQVPNETFMAPNGNRVVAGIELDDQSRRVAVWMYRAHPNEFNALLRAGAMTKERVPIEDVIHVYKPTRAGQLRGYPDISKILVKLRAMNEIEDSTSLRFWVSTLFAAVLKRNNAAGPSGVSPMTGMEADTDDDDFELMPVEPATIQELPQGWELDWNDPPEAGSTYNDFMRQQLMAAAAAQGMSYEILTGDLRGINDRLLRALLQEFRRGIEMDQHHVFVHQMCRPFWNRWMDLSVLAGRLDLPGYDINPGPIKKTRWIPERWPYLHPVQDVQAEEKEIRAGLNTRSERVLQRGEDVEELDREQQADNERARRRGLDYSTRTDLTEAERADS